MKRIKTYEDYIDIKNQTIAGEKPFFTNIFFFKNDIMDLIEKERLYYIPCNKNLLIMVKENLRYLLFVSIIDEHEISCFKFDLPVILEVVERVQNPNNKKFFEWISKNGFSLHATNIEMSRMPTVETKAMNQMFNLNYGVARAEDFDCIIELYKSGLDAISNPFPTKDSFVSLIKEGRIFVLSHPKDGILGTIQKEKISDSVVLISHVVIDSTVRGAGLGAILLYLSLTDQDSYHKLWVNQENVSAISLYRKFGFKDTKRISKQYLGGK